MSPSSPTGRGGGVILGVLMSSGSLFSGLCPEWPSYMAYGIQNGWGGPALWEWMGLERNRWLVPFPIVHPSQRKLCIRWLWLHLSPVNNLLASSVEWWPFTPGSTQSPQVFPHPVSTHAFPSQCLLFILKYTIFFDTTESLLSKIALPNPLSIVYTQLWCHLLAVACHNKAKLMTPSSKFP